MSWFSWGAILGVGIAGDFEGTAPTPSRFNSESMEEEPAVTRSVSLPKVGTGRYGASTYPFDPGNGGSLAPIRWDDGPGTVGEMTEENEGDHTTAAAGTAAAAATAAAASAGSSWI